MKSKIRNLILALLMLCFVWSIAPVSASAADTDIPTVVIDVTFWETDDDNDDDVSHEYRIPEKWLYQKAFNKTVTDEGMYVMFNKPSEDGTPTVVEYIPNMGNEFVFKRKVDSQPLASPPKYKITFYGGEEINLVFNMGTFSIKEEEENNWYLDSANCTLYYMGDLDPESINGNTYLEYTPPAGAATPTLDFEWTLGGNPSVTWITANDTSDDNDQDFSVFAYAKLFEFKEGKPVAIYDHLVYVLFPGESGTITSEELGMDSIIQIASDSDLSQYFTDENKPNVTNSGSSDIITFRTGNNFDSSVSSVDEYTVYGMNAAGESVTKTVYFTRAGSWLLDTPSYEYTGANVQVNATDFHILDTVVVNDKTALVLNHSSIGIGDSSDPDDPARTADVGEYDVTVTIYRNGITYSDNISHKVQVTPKPVTPTVADVTITQGQPIPDFAVSYEGVVEGETFAPNTPIILSCTATKDSPAGTYDITWSNSDYVFSTNGNYTLEKPQNLVLATLTINASSPSGGGGGGGGSYAPASGGSSNSGGSVSRQIANAMPGDSLSFQLDSLQDIPVDAVAGLIGQDIVLSYTAGQITWEFNCSELSQDVLLNFKTILEVETNTNSIPSDAIDAVAGGAENKPCIQFDLAHNGDFGFAATLSIPLGKEYDDRFANLYYYNPAAKYLEFQCASVIQDGKASWPFTHASSYAVVIDDVDHGAPVFTDVAEGTYYTEAVKWAVGKGITTGTSETTFSPEADCTRGQIVTFLWRAAGSPEPKSIASFADVKAGSYYAKAVAWAIENGITVGTSGTTFSPDETCTRAQAVTFLSRALKGQAVAGNTFSDVAVNSYYAEAVAWAVANGITNGTSATTFSPEADCTRGQIVTFLYRAIAE